MRHLDAVRPVLRDVPGLSSTRLPEAIGVTPVDGMAPMSEKADALRFAPFLLSDKGQAILANHGSMPVLGENKAPAHSPKEHAP